VTQARPPGWYPDENGTTRYWNGIGWASAPDPSPLPPPPGSKPVLYGTSPLPAIDPSQDEPAPWYRRTSFLIFAGIVGLVIVVVAVLLSTSPKKHPSNNPVHSSAGITSASAPSATSAAATRSFRMPNEVGRGLQAAQDDIQRVSDNPLFVSHSHDLLGSRFQVLDRDWKVCAQNIAPGRLVPANSDIDFGVVKLPETCP
jgi:hypothetical protein